VFVSADDTRTCRRFVIENAVFLYQACDIRFIGLWVVQKYGAFADVVPAVDKRDSVTRLLEKWKQGQQSALNELAPLVYAELRRLAAGYLRRERRGHTLQPTELVDEAFVRLIRQATPDYANRSHFIAIAAGHMRQILVDHARRRRRVKRGGGALTMSFDSVDVPVAAPPVDLLDLDAAMRELATFDARKSAIIEMHFFGGMRFEEIATVVGVHVNTVARDVRLARAWLFTRLSAR